ncbi:hypothetical protein RFI_17712 [Reticulomyxa filosa]|uniref:CAP-Gly domain-containing protein n=1 Tax=Reticulomyxa filosa TaxID=46433 RepID=X6N0T6_RETFI|nr:hypothetical protein RFI_17712 [Reticulomyxa filosa]|eukprot:ETO19518.1 hypothetical protein RFI_17712 [Reticulomyxa filosa]
MNVNVNPWNKSMDRMKPDYAVYPASIRVSINNDTFMARLSKPMWWIDGQFNRIPNKILSKNAMDIEIFSNYSDAPLVGILSFEVTLDPRYQGRHHYGNVRNSHHMPVFDAFAQPVRDAIAEGKVTASYLEDNVSYYNGPTPPWMVGPGGITYVPPAIHKLYNLQQQFADKQIETLVRQYNDNNNNNNNNNNDNNNQSSTDEKHKRKEEKREARVSKLVEQGIRQHQKSLIKAMQQLKKEKQGNDTSHFNVNPSPNANPDDPNSNNPSLNPTSNGMNQTMPPIAQTNEEDDEDVDVEDEEENNGEEEEEQEQKETGLEDDEAMQETDEFKPPKFRILLLWSVQPQAPPIPLQGMDTQMLRQKRLLLLFAMIFKKMGGGHEKKKLYVLSNMSVSTDVNPPNKFDVLLFEDDVDSEFHLDHSYFTQLEEAALIADIQQKLVEHELFEISATLGINRHNNQYQFVIDIDDSIGQWPFPPKRLNRLFAPPFLQQPSLRPMHPSLKPGMHMCTIFLRPISFSAYHNVNTQHTRHRDRPNHFHDSSSKQYYKIVSGWYCFCLSHFFMYISYICIYTCIYGMHSQTASGLGPSPRTRQRLSGPVEEKWRQSRSSKKLGSQTLSELVTQVDREKERRLSAKDNGAENDDNKAVPPVSMSLFQSTTHSATHMSVSSTPSPKAVKLRTCNFDCLCVFSKLFAYALFFFLFFFLLVSENVVLSGERKGQVKWVGDIDQNTIFGVRLVEPQGDSDGHYRGGRYFWSPPKCAAFVDRKEILQILDDEKLDYLDEEFEKDIHMKLLECAGNLQSVFAEMHFEMVFVFVVCNGLICDE